MTEEKQIEEMAKVIARRSTAFRNPNVAFVTTATKTAESLYTAGYRKASEVAREIFEEIGELVNEYLDGRIYTHDFCTYLAELKKKYTEEKNGTNN